MRVAIIGAGVTGMATAWALARDGVAVQIFDAGTAPGADGASKGNGGQLSYAFVAPLAQPSLLRTLPGLLLDRDGPVRWRPQARLSHWAWLIRFVLACRTRTAAETTRQLLALGAESRAGFDALERDTGIDFGRRRVGKLVIHRSGAGLSAAADQLRLQAPWSPAQTILDAAACRAIVPSLASGVVLAGGVWTPNEEVADAAVFCRTLADALGAQVRLRPQSRVSAILTHRGRVAALRCGDEDFSVDAVVVCAGVEAPALLAPLGLNVPVEPLKGCSLTLPPGTAPLPCSVTDAAAKVVFAPLGGALRVAGVADLVGHDAAVEPRRVATLRAAGRSLLPDAAQWDAGGEPWAGLRPATPTGRPLVGPTRVPGLFLNTGHGGLGWTLAAGSALRVARAVLAGDRPARPAPQHHTPYLQPEGHIA